MTEQVRTSEQIGDIAAALAKAQADIENVAKDRENPHFRAKYATLAGVLDEVRPKLAKHGISLLQMPINGEGPNIGVATRLLHSSGQFIESTLFVAPTKFDAQGAGSAITYLRRYSAMAMTGIAPEDDDGEAAIGRPQPRAQTNGATRTAAAPPPPTSRINGAALPPNPEETPEITAGRQRVRMLIDKYDHIIKTAPHAHALNISFDDGIAELAEIELAGENGKNAVRALRDKFMKRIAQLEEAAAA